MIVGRPRPFHWNLVVEPVAKPHRQIIVRGLSDLDRFFEQLSEPRSSRLGTLDLIAHSSSRHGCLLLLGDRLIDAEDLCVMEVFANHAQTLRSRFTELRLLGCRTAATPRGRATLARLAAVVGIPVRGAIEPVCDHYFDELGFRPDYDNRLVDGHWTPPPVGSWSML